MNKGLKDLLDIEFPVIMAPMFLVTNSDMVLQALKAGITAAIPAMNYRNITDFIEDICYIKSISNKPFGANIIVNKTNKKLNSQLKAVIGNKLSFVITSMGNPAHVIEQCHANGILVFCDVVDLKTAVKVEKLGADGIIAVNNSAGGHAGNLSSNELIPLLKKNCNIPVISAGGVANNEQYNNTLNLGADGLSIGTPFIATHECEVSANYKQAILNHSGKDIVLTNKMSGSPLHVINTSYVKSIGTKANFLENLIQNNPRLKKIAKMIILLKGTQKIKRAAFSATYKTVWVAGKCIEYITEIKSVQKVVEQIVGNSTSNQKEGV